MSKIVIACSGGCDPLTIGHVRLINCARAGAIEMYGNKYDFHTIFILNNDNWLVNKKEYAFMPEEERKEILLSMEFIDEVVLTSHVLGDKDRSVCRELNSIRPHIFANGGDRNTDIPEFKICEELGIHMMFDVGGKKIQSSSWLISNAIEHSREMEKEFLKFKE